MTAWSARLWLPILTALIILSTLTATVIGWRQAAEWRRDRQHLASLQDTIAAREASVRFPRELQSGPDAGHHPHASVGAYPLQDWLRRRLGPIEPMTPLACKLHLATTCRKMHIRLDAAEVDAAAALQFGFGRWTTGGDLPTPAHVPSLLRRLELIDELTYHVAQAQLRSLTAIEYLGEQRPDGDLVVGFRLQGTASPEGLRHWLERIDAANYVFVVRSIDWQLEPDGSLAFTAVIHYLELRPEPWHILDEKLTVRHEDKNSAAQLN